MERFADALWRPWLLVLFLVVGLWCSLGTGFFQLFGLKTWLRETAGKFFRRPANSSSGHGLTQFQALATALASILGTGSIAGVATAIFFGGPGAVFWMWFSAFLSLMTSFVEKTLSIKYRRRAAAGGWEGGPMEYMTQGLNWTFGAKWFSLWCVLASLSGGALVQSNSIAAAFHVSMGWNPVLVGVIVAFLTGAVIFGGIQRVGQVSEMFVPIMAALFLGSGIAVLAARWTEIPVVWNEIISSAFTPRAALGGVSGYSVSTALRYGIARGVFTNEAGVGSSAMAHAAAEVDRPAQEGFWGIFEVFFATMVVCTISALAILVSGVYRPEAALAAIQAGDVPMEMTGAPLCAAAFQSVLGRFGSAVVHICLLLFAFTSLLGWSYYGERGMAALLETSSFTGTFRMIFLGAVALGGIGSAAQVWALSDICNGMMALPNLMALAVLAPEAWRELSAWERQAKNARSSKRSSRNGQESA